MVVYTPKDPRRFRGTVVAEWNNVTAGYDSLPDFQDDKNTVFRDGDAYVGISAQFVGVASARGSDPARYESLTHPGNSYSYDIFRQAGAAVRANSRSLFETQLRRLVAAGDSQSAARLSTYANALGDVRHVYDGYLFHSRMPDIAPLQQAPGTAAVAVGPGYEQVPDGNKGLTDLAPPTNTFNRTDLSAPQLVFETQTDVYLPPNGIFGYGTTTQPNSRGFRLWEAAGTSHLDNCTLSLCWDSTDSLASAQRQFNALLNPTTDLGWGQCGSPLNSGDEN